MSEMFNNLAREYHQYKNEKQKLIQQREAITAKLEAIEDILIALDGILCKGGNHIYEHFEEGVVEDDI